MHSIAGEMTISFYADAGKADHLDFKSSQLSIEESFIMVKTDELFENSLSLKFRFWPRHKHYILTF